MEKSRILSCKLRYSRYLLISQSIDPIPLTASEGKGAELPEGTRTALANHLVNQASVVASGR